MDTQSNIKVKVDLKQAIKDFEILDQRVEETTESIQSLESQVLKLEKEQKALGPKQVNRYKDYTVAIDKVKQKLKEEKQDLKQLNNERKKAKKVVDDAAKSQKDYSGATSMADRATGGLVGQFQALKLATVGVTKGLGKVKIALIATGIGAFIVLLGTLAAAFTSSEKGQNQFSKMMGMIGVVVNNTMDIIANFGSSVISAGKALFKLATGDLKGASEAWQDAKDSVNEATDSIKNFGEETKKEMAIANDIANKRAKADKVERQLLVDRAEANRKYNELREKAADKENVSIQDRIAALKEAGAVEDEITAKEIEAAKLRFEAKKAENAMSKSTKEDLDEQARLEAAVIDLEAKRLKRHKTLTAEITTNLREAATERKAIAAEFEKNFQFDPIYGWISKEAIAKGKKDLEGIEKIQAEYAKKQQDDLAITDAQKLELEKERKLKELEDLNATEEQKANIIGYYNDKIAKAKKKEGEDEAKREKILATAKMNMAKNALMNISKALGENSKAGKAAAAAAALINTYQGITAELATKTATPWEFAIKLVNIASTAAIGFKSVKDIIATKPTSSPSTGTTPSGGRGASGMAPSVPSFNVVGAGAQSQLASALAEQETPPVQAYVVSQDVTTSQSLERNIVTGATIGG
ncbi:MAG: hypothetical protein Unbinned5607contig1000_27 [Prokaryotic dsDNA virus sp.]|nr:MAG: hypothetical protein Unbinned5607contig1000_27 [Prokaryotic dsDNA virus sp.]|tara:strand:+ start:7658 stop:9583 length:1926 start_codon:yes stop_codon:yes gene_type:complete